MAKKVYSKYKVDLSAKGKNKRTAQDYKTGEDIVFDSLTEKQFYEDNVVNGMLSGDIVDYELQKKYILQPSFKRDGKTIREINYIADVWVLYPDGSEKIFDIKPTSMAVVDPVAKLKRKMMYYTYPTLDYEWVCYTAATGWVNLDEYETLKKAKKKAQKELQKKEN